MNVFKFEVEKFLKFLFHLLNFCILLFNCLSTFSFYRIHVQPQPRNLLIFLLSYFLHSVFYHSLHILFLIHDLSQTPDLVLVLFFLVIELSARCFNLSLNFKWLFVLDFENDLHFGVFSFFSALLPSVKFRLHLKQFGLPIGSLCFLFLDSHLKLLKFGFGLTDLPVFLIKISLQGTQLFQQQFILELKIFSPSEPDPQFTQFIMHVIVIILKSCDFTWIKIHIVLGWRIVIYAFLDLCVQRRLQVFWHRNGIERVQMINDNIISVGLLNLQGLLSLVHINYTQSFIQKT